MKIVAPTLALLLLVLPGILFAQVNENLINLPASLQPGPNGFSAYINLLYALSISAAALLAVIKIIIAGVKYMLSDVVTTKGAAISEIKGALLGLLLIIGAVLILTVINPRLLDATLEFNPEPDPPAPVAPVTRAPVQPVTPSPNPNPSPNPAPSPNPNPSPSPSPSPITFTGLTQPVTSSVSGAYTYYSYNISAITPKATRDAQFLSFQRQCTLQSGANMPRFEAGIAVELRCRITN